MNTKLKLINDSPWYEEGLNFKCTGCAKCCEGAPGYVWVNDREIFEIAKFLSMPVEDFKNKYLVSAQGRYSIKDLPKANYRCVFLLDGKCRIYDKRPLQCRTYPFWPEVIRSKKQWQNEARLCEGICSLSPKISKNEIEKKAESMRLKS